MKRTITPMTRIAGLFIVISLFFVTTTSAQIRVSCDAPKLRDIGGDAKVTLEIGKQQCDEAKGLAKRASDLRKESEWLKNNAESEKNKAKELQEQYENRMRDAEKRTEEAMKVTERRSDHEKEIEEHLKFLDKRNRKFSEEISFQVYDTVSVAKPVVNGLDWEMGQEKAVEGFETYKTNIMELLNTDEMAVDSMGILLAGEGQSIMQRAKLHELRSQQHFATAATTLQVAEQLEGAAMVTERAALMHAIKATLFYVNDKSTADSKRVRKDVEKGISFIEDNLDKLPDDVALFAQYEIAKIK